LQEWSKLSTLSPENQMIDLWLLVLILFAVVGGLLLWPERGLLGRWRRGKRHDERERVEDVLKNLYESELEAAAASLQTVAGATGMSLEESLRVLQRMEERKLIAVAQERILLTPAGREMGLHVLRAHRLWESYLADQTGYPETEWHRRAHDLEHGLSPAEVDALSARLQNPIHDPHGDPIPTAAGEFSGVRGVPLSSSPIGRTLRVLHIEDEPAAVYAQLVAIGLQPGVSVRLLEVSRERVRLAIGGMEQVLAPLLAVNISVEPLAQEPEGETPAGDPLPSLDVGEEGRVLAISRRCRGAERRRLMDLGILPGAVIQAELRSPNGDPTAYRVRDALIALRAEQAQYIRVERLSDPAAKAA
jgi:DtxR family Mn-dependent transcriptional regulator